MTPYQKLQSISTSRLSVIFAAFYFLIAFGSLQLAFKGTNATPIWPPSGIAFIAVWFLGYRIWPGIWLGAFVANILVFTQNGWNAISAAPVSALIGVGNTIEALLGVFLLRSFTENLVLVSKIKDIFKFVFAVLIACLTSSTIGATAVYFSHPTEGNSFDVIWFTWWLGDVVGILVIAPIFMTFQKKLWQIKSMQNILEAVCAVLVLIFVNAGVFLGKFPEYGFYSHVTYLVLPFSIWSTYRFGFPGATVSVLITSVIAVFGSILHLGPFVGQRVPEDLVIVGCFIGVIAVTVLTLAAALFERQKAEEGIKDSEARFRSLVENSYDVIALIDTEARILYTSPPTKIVLGYDNSELLGHSMFEWIHPEDAPGVLEVFQGLIKSPGAYAHAICRMKRKDGSWGWMEGSGHNLLNDPTITAVVVNYRDITDKKQSEERFRQVVESAPNAMVMIDDKGKIQLVNKATEELFGYRREELLTMTVEQLVPQRFRNQHLEHRGGFHKDPKVRAMGAGRELYGLKKDGSEVAIEIGLNPIAAESRSFVLASIVDITERKRTERVLREKDERMNFAFEVNNIGAWDLDLVDHTAYRSIQHDRIFGYAELLPRWTYEMFMEHVIPQDRKMVEKKFQQSIKNKSDWSFECRILRADGMVRWISAVGRQNLDATEGVLRMSGIVQDISERKKSQLAIEESEQRFRTMADTAPVMIWMSGEDGLYTYFNKSWMTFIGQATHSVLGNGWRMFIHQEDFSQCLQVYLKAVKERQKFTLNYRIKRADGVYRWVLDTGLPRFNSDGNFGGFIGSCIDITQQKLAEEILRRDKESLELLVDERSKELIKAQKELKQFSRLADIGTLAATVAHELRNPLGVIQLAAYNLKRERSELSANKHLGNIEKKIWEGNHIIDNLLSYSRIKIPHYENLLISNILNESVTNLQTRYEEKGIKIERNFDDKLGVIEADPNQIQEILINILDNACQSISKPMGKVDLSAVRDGDMIKISVKDNGVGIAEEDLNKVFEPFFTRKSKGTGLGMTICNELVNLHNGKIEIKSSLGEGTTVTVILPIARNNYAEITSD